MKQWYDHWDFSDKGIYTNDLVPMVSLLISHTTDFFTGYRPIAANPFKLKRALSALCGCDDVRKVVWPIFYRTRHLSQSFKTSLTFYVNFLSYSITEPRTRFSTYSLPFGGSELCLLAWYSLYFCFFHKHCFRYFLLCTVHHPALSHVYWLSHFRLNFYLFF